MTDQGNESAEFLAKRYPKLAGSSEVTNAAKRAERLTGEQIPRDPEARINNYLNRFKEIVERDDPQARDRGITALKRVLVNRHVVRVEDIPDSYWQAQLRVVRNRGESGDWQDLPEEEVLKIKQEHLAQSKEDQKGSIEEWIDYLASEKSSYLPDQLKYWVFAGMLRLERYEKAEKNEHGEVIKPGRFPERPTGKQRSVKMFPEVNENGLKFIASAHQQQAAGKGVYWGYNQDIPQDARDAFLDALSNKDFRMAYGWVQEFIPPITDEDMRITEGENCGWATFSKELGHTGQDVAETLSGKGTGWCIAGKETAQENYLNQGAKLHIYYTRDRDGKQENPRVVIVELGGKVTEVRGIEWEENVDEYIKPTNIIGDKLQELPGGKEFFATDTDTKYLTTIDHKMGRGEALTGTELRFLYEVDRPIRYFGYKKDPRITQLRNQRNPEEDQLVVFGCETSQIAHTPEVITQFTKAYVGSETPDASQLIMLLKNCPENIYFGSFPEGKFHITHPETGGKTAKEYRQIPKTHHINLPSWSQDLLESQTFESGIPPEATTLTLGEFTVEMFMYEGETFLDTQTFYQRVKEKLGENCLCPPTVALDYLVSQGQNIPMNRSVWVGMEPITGSDGIPQVFGLYRGGDGLWLDGYGAGPGHRWYRDSRFLFCLPQV